jgi:hypothetical protein
MRNRSAELSLKLRLSQRVLAGVELSAPLRRITQLFFSYGSFILYLTILYNKWATRYRNLQAYKLYILNLEFQPEDFSICTSRNMLLEDKIANTFQLIT